MRYEIILAPEALEDLRRLRAHGQAAVRDALERYLRYEPMRTSKSRIKRLRGWSRPQYRLRVEDFRIYYDVVESRVEILAILSKLETAEWLRKKGEAE